MVDPVAGSVIHVAGPDIQIGARLRQRCAWCGAVLLDYDLDRIAVPEGQDPRPAMWPIGGLIEIDGPVSTAVPHQDGNQLPPSACGQIDHEVTGHTSIGRQAIDTSQGDQLREANAEIGRLRAGESDELADPGTSLTPAQWIRRFNDASPETRLQWAARVLDLNEAEGRCFQLDHEGRMEDLANAETAMARVRALRDRWAALPADDWATEMPSDQAAAALTAALDGTEVTQ